MDSLWSLWIIDSNITWINKWIRHHNIAINDFGIVIICSF